MFNETLSMKSAFMWNNDGFRALPPVPGADKSDVRGVGPGTLVVGFSETPFLVATIWIDGVAHNVADLVDVPGYVLNITEAADETRRLVVVDVGKNTLIILQPVYGDANCDRLIDWRDLLIVLANWGTCDANCPGDIDYDRLVGVDDLESLLMNWGRAK